MNFGTSRRRHIDVDVLSAYLDNQVTAAERAHIEEHLRACAICQQELNTLRQTVTLLRAMPRVRVPRAFTLSEGQAGIRGAGVRPAWPWGSVLKGLAAATAVVLVAFVATTLLRQPTWSPGPTIARVAPSPSGQGATPQAAPTVAAAQPIHAPKALPAEKSSAEPAAAPRAAAKSAGQTAIVTEAVKGQQEVASTSAPTKAPAPTAPEVPRPVPSGPGQPAADQTTARASETATSESVPGPTQAAEIPEMTVMATPGGEATPPMVGMAAAPGLGAGGGGGGAAGPELEGLAAEAAPPNAPIGSVLPANSGLAYADRQTLWTLDPQAGPRSLLQATEVNSPLISGDRTWIAYRTQSADHVELWAVPWSGQDPRLLLDERDIPENNLPRGYRERRIQTVQWIPGQHRLALTTTAVPTEAGSPPDYELWTLDAESGYLAYIANLGEIDHVFYAPDGKHLAFLRYGVPESGLWVFNTDGTGAQVAVKIAAGSAAPVYDGQISWLPDSSGLWAALADLPSKKNQTTEGLALYRVTVDGASELVRHIDALDAAWSPDGKRLAYTRPISDSMEARELYLASADGSAPQLYATPRYWAFLGWSPDSQHFLYQDNQLVYLGTPDAQPQPLGNFLSIFDPRWIAPDQFIHLLDQGTDWVLVSRWLDGRVSSLTTVPRDITYDITHP